MRSVLVRGCYAETVMPVLPVWIALLFGYVIMMASVLESVLYANACIIPLYSLQVQNCVFDLECPRT